MKEVLLSSLFVFVSALSSTDGAVYSVGPSQPYPTIGEALNQDLQPGDEVRIHARSSPYREKFVINNAGTSAAPITIRGVPDSGGNLPIVDGNGADTPLTQNYWNEQRSLIKIGGANTPSEGAAYIRIENLQLQNAHDNYSFNDHEGNPLGYAKNAACVHVEEGTNIYIVNNIISGCGNGIFVTSGVKDIFIEGNYIHGNGNVGSIYEHNTYTEALGITYRYNRFGPLCSGCDGNNLKDRSGGLTVAYNLIEGGNRQLDLVDAGNQEIFSAARYRETFVYGNILFENEDGNRQVVHYGGDSGNLSRYRKGTLFFYHNTVVSTRSGRTTFLRLSSADETCDARNNIFYTDATGNNLELLSEKRGSLVLRSNWIKANYVHSFETSGSGSTTEYNTISGTSPGFQDPSFQSSLDVRLSGPMLSSAALPSNAPAVTREYALHTSSRMRSSDDIGAYGYATNSAPTSTPAPTPAPITDSTPAPLSISMPPTSPPVGQPTTPSSSAPPTGSWCFSSENSVEVLGIGETAMDRLQVGDHVRTSNGFSRIFSFGHMDRDSDVEYLQIEARGLNQSLEITAEHMVFVGGWPIRADSVQVGDRLDAPGHIGHHKVLSIQTVKRQGAYAPITASGDIVVSGIHASSYVAPLQVPSLWQQAMAHALFAPHRLLCAVHWESCENESHRDGIAIGTTYPLLRITSVLCELPFLLQMITILTTMLPMAFICLIEQIVLKCSTAGYFLVLTCFLGYAVGDYKSNKGKALKDKTL